MRMKPSWLYPAGCLLLLSGCFTANNDSLNNSALGHVVGTVQGGTSPIAGSKVTLYEATSGVPIALVSGLSQSNGGFNFYYQVPPLGRYLYLVAQGGTTGAAPANPNINLINIIGEGPGVSTTATINETTTVMAYQAFTNDWTNNATLPTLTQTPANANALAISLSTYNANINNATGTPNGSIANQLSTQANVLAICVQNENECAPLATDLATSATDTLSLMAGLKIASANAMSSINTLLASYGPSLPYPAATQLSQNRLGILYNDPSYQFNQPIAVASSSQGNIWIANAGDGTSNLGSVTEIGNNGNFIANFNSTSYHFNNPHAIAIDSTGNIWVVNSGNDTTDLGSVTEMASDGSFIANYNNSSPGYDFNRAYFIAIDHANNLWITNSPIDVNFPGSVTEMIKQENGTYSGLNFNNTDEPRYHFAHPTPITIDPSGNIWVTNFIGGSVTELSANGAYAAYFNNSSYHFAYPLGITSDSTGNIWVSNSQGSSDDLGSITKMTNTGTFIANYTNNDNVNYHFDAPATIITDSSDNIWVANSGSQNMTPGNLTEMNNDGSFKADFTNQDYGIEAPSALTIDAGGNMWIVNSNENNSGSVTKLIS